jgi:hypothetical protein
MKQLIKDILVRAVGLLLATFFAGTGVGAIATNGDWFLGSIIGVGAAFAIVLTMIGVSMTWSGSLTALDVANAFRAAVAKSAEGNDNLQAALKVAEDGNFDWDDVEFEDSDDDLYDETNPDTFSDLAELEEDDKK